MKKFHVVSSFVFLLGLMIFLSCSKKNVIANPSSVSDNVAIYYVDADAGSDENDGITAETPWKSLEKVNAVELKPGWQVLFKAGSVYNGQLRPTGSGEIDNPIIIDKYGDGELPRIDAWGKHKATLLLSNVEYYEISNLELTNYGTTREAGRKGVHITVQDIGVARHIHLKNLYVHDVNGSNVKDEGGGYGIHWSCSGDNARFENLLIENCHLKRTDRNGITSWVTHFRPDDAKWNPSTNVVIRGNLLENIGGDGIVPIGTDGCIVEYNVLNGGRMRAQDYAAGIWPWGSTNTIIQYNEVSGMKGTKDGQGFDCDFECSGTIIQYNYSHDNDGGFILICGPSRSAYGNQNSIVRYNISQNDGSNSRIFHISGGSVTNTLIYNNTIYSNLDNILIQMDNWEGWPENTFFYNNLFYVDGDGAARYRWGQATGTVFESNVFFGTHAGLPDDPNAVTEDPRLGNPGNGQNGIQSLNGYHLQDGSPCIQAGRPIPDNGGQDFWGNPVPQDGKPDIGAFQTQ